MKFLEPNARFNKITDITAEFLKEHIESELHPKEVRIDYLGPIIGSTTGPGTVAIFFFGKEVTIVGEE